VKISILKLSKAYGQLKIMERDGIILISRLVGGYYNIRKME
jgi:hypothetical protein